MAGTHNITILQGATFSLPVTWETSDGGAPPVLTPVNITGYSIRMQIRTEIDAVGFIDEFTTGGGEILLTDAANGKFTLTITDTATTLYTEADFESAVYDLELVSGGGVVTRLIEGTVTLSKEVTR